MHRRWSLALVAIACAAIAQHPVSSQHVPAYVVVATIAAIVGAALAFPPMHWRGEATITAHESRPALALAAASIAGAAVFAVMVWRLEPFQITHEFTHTASTIAALVWLGGLIVGLWHLWHAGTGRASSCRDAAPRQRDRWIWIALLFILVVAATLRLWHLSSLPEGVWADEADSAADSVRLLHLPFQSFAPGNSGHNPSLYFYFMAALIWIGGNSGEIIRLTSALFGLASVAVAFMLGYKLRGAPLALIACAFMGMAQWSLTFSRVAMPDIPIPAVTGLGYVLFFVAMRRPRALWFALSGAVLGLSFLTYPGAYLPALVPVFVLLARCRADLSFGRASWPARLFLPLCLAVTAAPFLTSLMLDGNFVLLRVHVTSLYNEYHDLPHRLSGLMDNLRTYSLMFTVQGDRNGRHNLCGAPMLDPIMGMMFLLGLGISLRQARHWISQTLLLWTAANLLSGILSVDYEAPHAARTLGALAPVAIIAALPILYLPVALQAIARRAPWPLGLLAARAPLAGPWHPSPAGGAAGWTALARLLAALILLAALALNVNQYFWKQAHSLASWTAMDGRLTIMGRAIESYQREGFDVLAAPAVAHDQVLRYVAPDWQPRSYDAADPLRGLPASLHVALVMPESDRRTLDRVLRLDPAARVIKLAPDFDRAAVQAYVVLLVTQPTIAR